MLLLTSFSDWRQTRGLPAAAVFCIGIVGWSLLLGLNAHHNYHARYFGCICVVVAGYTNIPIIICEFSLKKSSSFSLMKSNSLAIW